MNQLQDHKFTCEFFGKMDETECLDFACPIGEDCGVKTDLKNKGESNEPTG